MAVQNSSAQHLESHYVSTGEETSLIVKFHDPEHFLNQAQEVVYYWFVNDINYGTTREPMLKYNFTEAKLHTIMVIYSFSKPKITFFTHFKTFLIGRRLCDFC